MDPKDWGDAGRLVDRVFQEMGIVFAPGYDPRRYRYRRWRRAGLSGGAVAAAVAITLGGWLTHRRAPAHPAPYATALRRGTADVALAWLPSSSRAAFSTLASVPVWSDPRRTPLRETTLVGSSTLYGVPTNAVVALAAGRHLEAAVGYRNGRPVWYEAPEDGFGVVTPAPVLPAARGRWIQGGPTDVTSFSAAGAYIYVSRGPEWTVLDGRADDHWAPPPTPNTVETQVTALPARPGAALLLNFEASGRQDLFARSVAQGAWTPAPLPDRPVRELVGSGSHYWMLAGGKLYVSADGVAWSRVYAPPSGFDVQTFAVSPAGDGHLAVSLAPTGQTGIGPILVSADGGASWHELPPPWPNGSGASALAVGPHGDVLALLPGPPLLLEHWSPDTGRWSLIPLPVPNQTGIGTLAAYTDGDLLYSDAVGHLYRWLSAQGAWLPIPSPPGVPERTPPTLLMGIGSTQVLAAYPHGWYIFVPDPPAP
ncbi:MAG: hypothetical protein K6V97_06785 [Actinomycetia bacterium]|nr:hypothetical protein [Actinomycetes bacterium]